MSSCLKTLFQIATMIFNDKVVGLSDFEFANVYPFSKKNKYLSFPMQFEQAFLGPRQNVISERCLMICTFCIWFLLSQIFLYGGSKIVYR